jgi:hypothetical protein
MDLNWVADRARHLAPRLALSSLRKRSRGLALDRGQAERAVSPTPLNATSIVMVVLNRTAGSKRTIKPLRTSGALSACVRRLFGSEQAAVR